MKMMKKVISLVLCLISVFTVFYFNSSASDENVFTYSELSDGTVKITKYNGNEKEVTIPDTIDDYFVTSIDFMAFSRCFDIEKIVIGKHIKSIGDGAFSNCTSLKSIVVSNDNNTYSVKDNVLFNKNITHIICYPAQKSGSTYIMPDSVEIISMNAFSKCAFLENVELSDNLKAITMYSFVNCEKLNSIIISHKLEKIEQNGIDGFSEQLRIYYNGSKEQWNEIILEGNSKEQLNKIVVCKDDDKDYTIKLSEETELIYSSKVPLELKVFDKTVIKVDGAAIKNNAGQYEITAKITPLKSGECTISAVAENGFVLCNFNYTVEECSHSMVFYQTLEAETCTEDGKQLFRCEYCDYTKEEIVKSTGHSMGEWKVEVKATKEKEGLEVRTCNNFNCDYREEKVVPKISSATESDTEPDNSTGNTSTKFLLGDVDSNKKVNATDARKVLRYVAGLETLNSNQLKAANVDGNSKVTATDARKILRYVAGLESL